MKYTPPMYESKPQWVPIVTKNRDFLIGFINGSNLFKEIIAGVMQANDIKVNFSGIDLCLDSSRFNDILENGIRESTMTKEQLKNYFDEHLEDKMDSLTDHHPDNEDVFGKYFLKAECICGLGTAIYKKETDIPETQVKCELCGRVIIDYTGLDDDVIEFDGNLQLRE